MLDGQLSGFPIGSTLPLVCTLQMKRCKLECGLHLYFQARSSPNLAGTVGALIAARFSAKWAFFGKANTD